MRIVLAAGGTGGHIFPARAVAEALRRASPESKVLFIGIGKELEQKLIAEAGYDISIVPAVPISGYGILGLFRFLFSLPLGILRVRSVYKKFKPEVVLGFGGYPSFVPLFTAWLGKLPAALHEQNVQVGLANKISSRFVRRIFAVHRARGFAKDKEVIFLANPVREEFYNLPAWSFPSSGARLRVLVVGGSQGAVSLNIALENLIPLFQKEKIELVHQTGATDYERVCKRYEELNFTPHSVLPFIDDMAAQYRNAHLIICRAGALTVAEVLAAKRPAIFVPLTIAAGHQADNVAHLLENSAAFMLEQSADLGRHLNALVSDLLDKPQTLANCVRNLDLLSKQDGGHSADIIAQKLLSLVKN